MLSVSSAECVSPSQISRLNQAIQLLYGKRGELQFQCGWFLWKSQLWTHHKLPLDMSLQVTVAVRVIPVLFCILCYLHRWLMAGFYLSFIIIVPSCYVKIYRYRQILIVPGSGQRNAEVTKFRKSRNIVTFSYNITIWSVEAVSTFVVRFQLSPNHH